MNPADGLPFDIIVLAALGVFVGGLLAKVSEELRKRR